MATPTAAGAMAPPPAGASAALSGGSKSSPHLHSVASSLRACLDGMLPDTLRNDAAGFQLHLSQQKARIPTEKNSWRYGLNYIFETLKQHKEWYARNQQFVQLRKDVKRFESHVGTVRTLLSEAVSTLDLEAGLRVAELDGRVGAYKIMFEVTKIVTKLSRPLVKLQILKPSESSLSIYCDTFVLDIVIADGEGAVESASLMTVEKDTTQQFPERDDDLLRALKQLAAGDSGHFMDKLNRLVNRAELAIKYPSMNFEQLETDVYTKLSEASASHNCWSVTRIVDGIAIHFKDALHCLPIVEPPRKKIKVDDAQHDLSTEMKAGAANAGTPRAVADEPVPDASDIDSTNTLMHGEWAASVSFIEWRGEIALHIVGETPLVMSDVQARRLALAVMRPLSTEASASAQEDDRLFNEFVSWVAPPTSAEETRKAIAPQLRFTRDRSVCSVSPPSSTLAMRQEYSLVTKEISGGLQIHSFPIPLSYASTPALTNVLQICGHSLFFYSVLLSAFSSRSNIFGRRIHADNEDAIHVPIKVDVSAPERITLKTEALPGMKKQLLIEICPNSDCTLGLSIKIAELSPKGELVVLEDASLSNPDIMQKLSGACHSVPLLAYFALQRALQQADSTTGNAASNPTTGAQSGAQDCNGIVSLDDDMAVPVKMEGEDMLLDDMNLF